MHSTLWTLGRTLREVSGHPNHGVHAMASLNYVLTAYCLAPFPVG